VAERGASGNGCGEVGGKLDLGLVWETGKWVGMVVTIRGEWLLWCKKKTNYRILKAALCAGE
jgi:hypothetical protein